MFPSIPGDEHGGIVPLGTDGDARAAIIISCRSLIDESSIRDCRALALIFRWKLPAARPGRGELDCRPGGRNAPGPAAASRRPAPAALERVADLVEEQNAKLAAALSDGIADGSIAPGIDPRTAATALWATMNGILSLSWRADRLRAEPGQLDAIIATAEAMTFHGLIRPRPDTEDFRTRRSPSPSATPPGRTPTITSGLQPNRNAR